MELVGCMLALVRRWADGTLAGYRDPSQKRREVLRVKGQLGGCPVPFGGMWDATFLHVGGLGCVGRVLCELQRRREVARENPALHGNASCRWGGSDDLALFSASLWDQRCHAD